MEFKSLQHKLYVERAGLLKKNKEVELDEGIGHFVVKQLARLADKNDLHDHHINVAQKKVNSNLGTGHPQADNILNKHKKLAKDSQYHKKSEEEARQHFADNMQTLHNDVKSVHNVKEEVEQIDESFEELTPSKHGSFSVNSKVTSPKEGFHKGQYVGIDTLIHKGTIQHKDNSKPSKFEIHNHVNRGLIFQTHHSDEEKQAIKQHLIKNKYAGKGTDITD